MLRTLAKFTLEDNAVHVRVFIQRVGKSYRVHDIDVTNSTTEVTTHDNPTAARETFLYAVAQHTRPYLQALPE